MFYSLLEDDIKTKLTTDLGSSIEVEVMPETQAAFSRPFLKPRVEVCYKNSDFKDPNSVFTISQEEYQVLELVIWCKLRRGTNGIYDILEKVRKSIIGFEPTHCGKIYLKSFKPEDYKDNLWTYTLTIQCKTMVNEDFTEVTEPLLTESHAQYPIIS